MSDTMDCFCWCHSTDPTLHRGGPCHCETSRDTALFDDLALPTDEEIERFLNET